MHSKMTSPFYPTVLVVWGSSVAFCYKCLRVFLSFCSTDGKVGWDITKGFVGCSEPLLFLLMLWQVSRCCPAVRDPKCHLPFGLCGDDNLLLECKQDSFHIWPPTPPPHQFMKPHFCHDDSSRPIELVCLWPPWCEFQQSTMSVFVSVQGVGLQVISVAPVGGSQRGLL